MIAWSRTIFRYVPAVLGLLFASRAEAQQRVMIPVHPAATHGARIELETFIYRPTGRGPFPLLILNHGSSDGDPASSMPAPDLARYFVAHGFAVMVPMRRGRGRSTGHSREYEDRRCAAAAWAPGIRDAMDDLSSVLEYAGSRRELDTTGVVLAGVSRGGFLSIAYAAEGRDRHVVLGAINFVGAWIAQREDRCPRDFNAVAFARFGHEIHVPTLWLYGDADPYNTTRDIQSYVEQFRSGGGNAELLLVRNVPGNGHRLAEAPALWTAAADAFLGRIQHYVSHQARIQIRDR